MERCELQRCSDLFHVAAVANLSVVESPGSCWKSEFINTESGEVLESNIGVQNKSNPHKKRPRVLWSHEGRSCHEADPLQFIDLFESLVH